MAEEQRFRLESLGKHHNRAEFTCGMESLDSYLKTQASQDMRRKASAVFVLTPLDIPNQIAGYFTLCAYGLAPGTIPDQARKHIPRYPVVSATLIGRLAVSTALLLAVSLIAIAPRLSAQAASQPEAVLHAAEAAKILPDQVFFRGQTATTQARNATGVRYVDGLYTLAIIVDNSGYSTGIQEKYQAYLLTEVSIEIGGHNLPPGAYGIGITKSGDTHTFQAMDIAAHELFSAPAVNDQKLHRPRPLQVIASGSAGRYRLYFGRNYVEFARAK